MPPAVRSMEGFSKAIQQPEYVHVLLNHFPITGLFVAWVFLAAALVLNNRSAQFLGLGLVALLALSVWPVAHFGEAGYDRVLAMSDDAGGQYLKHHAELADRWAFLYYVTAGVAAGALVAGWRKPKWLRPASGLVVLLAAASLVAGAVIADCGGKIRHREFRYGPPLASFQLSVEPSPLRFAAPKS
jgi:phosphoglycerol transferase MdoB-like AlkP superfamily enzyme